MPHLLTPTLTPAISPVYPAISPVIQLSQAPAALNPAAALAAHVKAFTPEPYVPGIQRTLEALGGNLSPAQAMLLLILPELFSLAHGERYLLQIANRLAYQAQPWKFLGELIQLRSEMVAEFAHILEIEETALVNRLGFTRNTRQPFVQVLPALGRSIGQGSVKLGSSALGAAKTAVGPRLSAANVGFDAYQVYRDPSAPNIAQLSVDSVGLSMALGSITAGSFGAPTAAAVLGGAAVPLAGVGLGIVSLINAYAPIEEGAQQVGAYFNQLDQAYREGAIQYNAEKMSSYRLRALW